MNTDLLLVLLNKIKFDDKTKKLLCLDTYSPSDADFHADSNYIALLSYDDFLYFYVVT